MNKSLALYSLWHSSAAGTGSLLGVKRFNYLKSFYLGSLSKRSLGSIMEANSRIKATIDDESDPDRIIHHEGKEYKSLKEGLARILIPARTTNPKAAKAGKGNVEKVFYNPVQQFNRDLSVLAIRAFGEEYLAQKPQQLRSKTKRKQQRRKESSNSDRGGTNGLLAQDVANHDAVSLLSGEEAPENMEPETLRINATSDPPYQQGTKRRADSVNEEGGVLAEQTEGPNGKRLRTQKNEEISEDSQHSATQQPTQHDLKRRSDASNDIEAEQGHVQNAAPSTTSGNKLTSSPNYKLNILDALSASGLRALRYARELPFQTSVTANDLSADATKSIEANVRHNKVESNVAPKTGNAQSYMYSYTDESDAKKYNVVDIDPYGTAVPFLDAALQAVSDGGLLCISCTDAGVWASTGYPEKAFSLYGGSPVKGAHSHEVGLRLIIHSIATAAARHSLAVEPLLSMSVDFYARVFVKVRKSAAEVKFLAGKTIMMHNCDSGCGAWSIQPLGRFNGFEARDGTTAYKFHLPLGPSAGPMCDHCGFKTHVRLLACLMDQL